VAVVTLQTTAFDPHRLTAGFFKSYNTLLFPHTTLTRWSL